MPKPICVKCHRFFRCVKTGFYFTEGMPTDGAQPGLVDAEYWVPYKLWVGDKYQCEGCGTEIITGFGKDRIAEHYQPGFWEERERIGADQFQVNDC